MLKALPSLLQNLSKPAKSARDEFYEKFQHTADEYDDDFIKKYDEDLNTTLIFVSSPYRRLNRRVDLIFFRGRPACSPVSRLLSSSMCRKSLCRITRE